jgi:hypothetical protein
MANISKRDDQIGQLVNRWYDRLGWAIIGAIFGSGLGKTINSSLLIFLICIGMIVVLIFACTFWEAWLRRKPVKPRRCWTINLFWE